MRNVPGLEDFASDGWQNGSNNVPYLCISGHEQNEILENVLLSPFFFLHIASSMSSNASGIFDG